MLLILNLFIWAIVITICLPILVLAVECMGALFSQPTKSVNETEKPSDWPILMPAHNEEACIEKTLKELLPQVSKPEDIVVVADNCSDKTAEIARSLQVTVIERQDENNRGKGYALAYGLDYLASNPPSGVIFVDADCLVTDTAISKLIDKSTITDRPIQALYLMEKPQNPSPKDTVSAFAFLVKNWVRPSGLNVLKLPCLLTGTGMAFPWSIISQANLADANIVEDMQLGINLAIDGYPPLFCPEARVIGILPQKEQIAKKQRTRWEHGHLQTILTQVPRLLQAALYQGNWPLLGLALELSVPPLSLLVMLWILGLVITLITGLVFSLWLPSLILTVAGVMMFISILSAWAKFGKNEIPFSSLVSIPLYLFSKVSIYLGFIFKPESKWIKTERD